MTPIWDRECESRRLRRSSGPPVPSQSDKARIEVLTLAATISAAREGSYVGLDCRGRGHSRSSCSASPWLKGERVVFRRAISSIESPRTSMSPSSFSSAFDHSLPASASTCVYAGITGMSVTSLRRWGGPAGRGSGPELGGAHPAGQVIAAAGIICA